MEEAHEMTRYDTENDAESETLLPNRRSRPTSSGQKTGKTRSRMLHVLAFAGGILTCIIARSIVSLFQNHSTTAVVDSHFPPKHPSNWYPASFPSNVGHAGPTPTGAEPAILATASAYPRNPGSTGLIAPAFIRGTNRTDGFNLFRSWGSLSPWYSVPSAEFGLPEASVDAPARCRITGVHLLHRHGARYPESETYWGYPTVLVNKLQKIEDIGASDELEFLNHWSYPLGAAVLTPFGRGQMYALGVSWRMRYGFLLNNFTEANRLPIFRTESMNRMLESTANLAFGFFGHPVEGQYETVVMVQNSKLNNTISPYDSCPNANDTAKAYRGVPRVQAWAKRYLADAIDRFNKMAPNVKWTVEDVYAAQMMCPYETVALGYSKFCELFTKDEWDGFDYALDIGFWYNDAYGSPLGQALGLGWLSELVARLIHTPIAVHNTSTNATMHDETVFLNILVAMNLTQFSKDGQLPTDHIPLNRKFKSSKIAPFGTNMQVQLLSCTSHTAPQIRIIVNDGVVPLASVKGCPQDKDGMCSVDTFVAAQKEIWKRELGMGLLWWLGDSRWMGNG
ncbi:histidine phosphatase family containing protein [Ceratobasidium sp. AG-Ba]|nr:histidine phosphatase family containing protein [Ceratobasidium sp. AG-Ba]